MDIFTDKLNIVRSNISAAKTAVRINIHEHRSNPPVVEVANPQRGRPQGFKDKVTRKRITPGLPERIPPQESKLMAISSPFWKLLKS